ncbi:copper amine oxidase N-terminal domain-containing protein [Paenibacillus antri]|uniref:Copper amine oxidase N-terminal domain-containing protein n=1 Tax=Paenibacillus antri TaxID=2582848 RepID=A0A5R9GEE2_9BACL|nr:copper amine oxidase N-terminal domain-containing protein [Paenibacillus antri]TLS49755.1 copper amine oxidase N-terminal domain-containing protein [Paenibacillus antri]
MNKTLKTALIGGLLSSAIALGTASAATAPVEVQVQIGNENVKINEQTIQVAKPYLSNNVTLVPLRVITSAFGAEVKWDEKTSSIGLAYEGRNIQLTIGSKNVSVDGESSTLEAAPELSSNTTMVPLRFITQTFGAAVNFDAATSTITIQKGSSEAGEDIQLTDQDADSTHIGDSYYGWSIEYLPEISPWDNEFSTNFVRFDHLKDEFTLYVHVFEEQPEMSAQGLMKEAAEYADGSILSQTYVKNGGYAKVVSKDPDGTVSEIRVYMKGDKEYFVTLNTSTENFNDKQKWASYVSFLDTFSLSFDGGNPAYKDISNVKDGYRSIEASEYGLAFKVPVDWFQSETAFHKLDQYLNEDFDQYFQNQVTSREPGDTPEAWAGRIEKQYKDQYVSQYLKIGALQPIEIDGIKGVARTDLFGNGSSWHEEYEIFLMEGDYKYYFSIGYPEELPAKEKEELRSNIVKSIEIDPSAMSPNLGELYDSWDNTDYEHRVLVNNSKAKYSIKIPEYWMQGSDHDGGDSFSYILDGADFTVFSQLGTTLSRSDLINAMDAAVAKQSQDDPNYRLIGKSSVSLFGSTPATKFELSYKSNGYKILETAYIFEKNGRTYMIGYRVNEANATESTLRRIQETIDSIEFK